MLFYRRINLPDFPLQWLQPAPASWWIPGLPSGGAKVLDRLAKISLRSKFELNGPWPGLWDCRTATVTRSSGREKIRVLTALDTSQTSVLISQWLHPYKKPSSNCCVCVCVCYFAAAARLSTHDFGQTPCVRDASGTYSGTIQTKRHCHDGWPVRPSAPTIAPSHPECPTNKTERHVPHGLQREAQRWITMGWQEILYLRLFYAGLRRKKKHGRDIGNPSVYLLVRFTSVQSPVEFVRRSLLTHQIMNCWHTKPLILNMNRNGLHIATIPYWRFLQKIRGHSTYPNWRHWYLENGRS